MWILKQLPVALTLYLIAIAPLGLQVVAPQYYYGQLDLTETPSEFNFDNLFVRDIFNQEGIFFLEAIDKTNSSITYIIALQNGQELYRIKSEGERERKAIADISDNGLLRVNDNSYFDEVGSNYAKENFYHYSLEGELLDVFSLTTLEENVGFSYFTHQVQYFDGQYFFLTRFRLSFTDQDDLVFFWDGQSDNLTQIMTIDPRSYLKQYVFDTTGDSLSIYHFLPENFDDGTNVSRFDLNTATMTFTQTQLNQSGYGTQFLLNNEGSIYTADAFETNDRGAIWQIGYEGIIYEISISEGNLEYWEIFSQDTKFIGVARVDHPNGTIVNQVIQMEPRDGLLVKKVFFINSVYEADFDLLVIKPLIVGSSALFLAQNYTNGLYNTDFDEIQSMLLIFENGYTNGIVPYVSNPPLHLNLIGLGLATLFISIRYFTRKRTVEVDDVFYPQNKD